MDFASGFFPLELRAPEDALDESDDPDELEELLLFLLDLTFDGVVSLTCVAVVAFVGVVAFVRGFAFVVWTLLLATRVAKPQRPQTGMKVME